jgi:hypothetical protein
MRAHHLGWYLFVLGLVLSPWEGAPLAACDRWCSERAPLKRYAAPTYGYRGYGYRGYLAPRPIAPLPTRRALRNVPPVPGGSTTLDPPGLMSEQGILESPVPGPGPSLFGGPVYGYSAVGAPRWRRSRY